ncbi:putative ribonuclease H-like domain-containing protein [Tanacetum coccineum]|uniref:Ribonuclease H-like domain-containing protein n=1 Tax=Tanacetum coccineum TaxID=301880 RepID=A0ABQ5FLD4_9ASTR
MLMTRKRDGPLPSHRLALRYSEDHSSLDNFSSDDSLDSSSDSSGTSSGHSLSDTSFDTPAAASARPSCKRCRTPAISISLVLGIMEFYNLVLLKELNTASFGKNGNSFQPVPRITANADGTSTSSIPGPVTTEEKTQKKNDVKARSMLLMVLPNEHLLTFSQYKDAKTLFEAIHARFGGNDATRKTQKTILKQMYENFNASSTESLDSIFNKLQKIVSQLAILGENISQEDLNLKLLRSLPAEWNTHVVVWRNKPDLDTMSFDDLYNNFKIVEQEVKRTVSSSSNSSSQNMAFVSSPSSTNEVNTANIQVSTASTPITTASLNDNTANLSDATVYAFLANQPNGSQLVHEDLEQIHKDDLEEMDLKWQLALLSMRARRYYQRTSKKITINGSDIAGYDKTKVECFNCHKMGYFTRECRSTRHQESRPKNQDNSRKTVNVEETSSKAIVAIDGAGFDWSFMEDEEVPTNMDLMAFSDSELRTDFNKSEFDLATYKRGLASVEEQLVFYKKNEAMFCDQIAVLKKYASFRDSEITALNAQIENLKKEKESNKIKIESFENASKSLDKLIGSQISDNNRKGVGFESYNVPEFEGYGLKANKSVSENSSNETKKTTDAPIIEEWFSDSDEDEFEAMESDNVQHKPEQANQPRKMVQKPMLNNEQKGTGQREVRPVWNNAMRTNHQNFSNSRRNFAPTAVLTKSGLVPTNTARQSSSRVAVPVSTARPINTAAPKTFVNVAKPRPNAFQKSHSPFRRPFYQQIALKNRNLSNKVNTAKINFVNTVEGKRVTSAVRKQGINAVKSSACWVWRSTGKVIDHVSKNSASYICDPQVALKDTRIFDSGCSRHMTGNKSYLIDYQDYDGGFELKFNLFSVSQMCERKNSVLFTKSECLILSPEFKLPDESQVMLKIPKKDNMYSFDLKNVVPSKGLTCLFAKATNDESKMWHRRLGHINFKTINKLVKGNLVRGLPLKIFENDHTCVACQKGKQHKATCKSKLVNSVCQPLQILHMDLFGPTFVKSIMGKMYCLVVTDDYSRFSWVFFLAKKDETCGILKDFITGIENQLDHKVKIIRCDNGTEFKNYDMNQFCGIKGIKREFSNVRTLQQNGVAKRKNRTLIEAARTMVLVTKPHNKTPYELLIGRTPIISFMRPFGCPFTILNTLDYLGKFDGKTDEGFLVGYSINSKAFRVFNSRTRKVEENLHVNFLEIKPNDAGIGPTWLFDIDSLTNSINYQPVSVGNRANGYAGLETNSDAGKAGKEKVHDQEYILLPLLHTSSYVPSSSKEAKPNDDAGKKATEQPECVKGDKTDDLGNPTVNTASIKNGNLQSTFDELVISTPITLNAASSSLGYLHDLEDTGIFDDAYDDRDEGAEADYNNLETGISVSPIPSTRANKDHPKDQIIREVHFAV